MADHTWESRETTEGEETHEIWYCPVCGASGGGLLGTPNPSFQYKEVSSDCDRARKYILAERRRLGLFSTWRDTTSQLGQEVPGLVVRGDGSGLMGGLGLLPVGRQGYREPFFLRQAYLNEGGHDYDVDGLYVATVTLLRYGGAARESSPRLLEEAIWWLIREYQADQSSPIPQTAVDGPRKSAWEHLLEAEDE